jgi:hypothetical protein
MNKLVLAAIISTVASAPFAAFANDAAKTPAATSATATNSAAATHELQDGTKIEVIGDKVEVIGKDGKKTPAPDGEHTLKDGSKITTKGGLIVKK